MIETATRFQISSIIQYMSHVPNFYIASDSVCMSTGCLPNLAEQVSEYLSLPGTDKFRKGKQKWLLFISYSAVISFISIDSIFMPTCRHTDIYSSQKVRG